MSLARVDGGYGFPAGRVTVSAMVDRHVPLLH